MNAQDAIDIISNGRHDYDVINDALALAVNALKLQIPVRPTYTYDKWNCTVKYKCGVCQKSIRKIDNYCGKCGRAIEFPKSTNYDKKPGDRRGILTVVWPDGEEIREPY